MRAPLSIRSILVALDASADSLAAAWTAAQLAELFEAELTGVFVEDEQLVRLSRSPLAHQADPVTHSIHQLRDEDLEAQLHAQARQARRELEQIAQRLGIRWSFRVTRGLVAQEILQAAAKADLVTLGRMGWSLRQRRALGTTVQALLARGSVRTLLLGPRREARPPVTVIFDGSEVGREALQLAFNLSKAGRLPMVVALLGSEESKGPLAEEVRKAAEGHRVDVRMQWLGNPTAHQLARAMCRSGGRLIVAPFGGVLSAKDHLETLLNETDCQILAVS